ncbi:hypothetical protein D9758_006760 [Tetrapyrgos nigripes]|uniref:Uncharacterized protein n=1 Tax=Tetrapyrgos nigripes TaxID=182062 RepID=A0A8H5CWW2_9AGAR|nr:hypothetical protein D9758_006760 [Tetrapyrgos nigripes]
MLSLFASISFLAFSGAVLAQSSTATATAPAPTQTIWVTVGLNTTNNASAVFQPANIKANLGDTVIFNFTQGNHSATQSTFDTPCIPAHETNITLNGFDSGSRIHQNNSAVIDILSVPILEENFNMTMWFYDVNTCGEGGVGVINSNDSSTETYDGFRNAIRLNGTQSSSISSTASRTATVSATSTPTSGAQHNIASTTVGVVVAFTLAFQLATTLLV